MPWNIQQNLDTESQNVCVCIKCIYIKIKMYFLYIYIKDGIVKDGEPGVMQSVGLQRVRHDLATVKKQQNSIHIFLYIKCIYI